MLLRRAVLRASATAPFEALPAPRHLPLVGTALALMADGGYPQLPHYVDRRHRRLGPIFREAMGPTNAVFIADPEAMRAVFAIEGPHPRHVLPEAWTVYNHLHGCPRGLFFMDGPNWLHHRKIMNGFMLKGDLDWMGQACALVADNLVQDMDRSAAEERIYENLEETLYRWSLEVVVSILLGAEPYSKRRLELLPQISYLASILSLVFHTSTSMALLPATLASKWKIAPWRRFVKSVDDALSGATSLLTSLSEVPSSGLLSKLQREDIRPEELSRIIADLILAAGDTTAYAMEWLLYLVARHPHVQSELRAEPALAKHALRECLRLYPVAPFLTRFLPQDAVVAGYALPKDTLVVLSIFTSGRDEKYFKDALRFWPQRWDRVRNPDYHSTMQKASLPFAMGSRSCVGKRIAEMQLQMTLCKIVERFDVELCNKEEVEMVLKMVAVPSSPIQLKFTRRTMD